MLHEKASLSIRQQQVQLEFFLGHLLYIYIGIYLFLLIFESQLYGAVCRDADTYYICKDRAM